MVEQQDEPSQNVLRSQVAKIQVPVRFKNRSGRRVKIIWLNYEGEESPYATLERFSPPDSGTTSRWTFVVNTYMTNPWIAVDETSNERMLLNFEKVYMPKAPRVRQVDYQRRKFIVERTDVLITAPVYSLEEYCMRRIQMLVSEHDITKLELPEMLKKELAKGFQQK